MLRVSATTTNTEVDIQGINGDSAAAAKGIEHGEDLMQFADAVAGRDETALRVARDQLRGVAGDAVLVDAAGVAANFQRMVRIADSMGIPVDNLENEMGQEVRRELKLDQFPSAQNSLGKS